MTNLSLPENFPLTLAQAAELVGSTPERVRRLAVGGAVPIQQATQRGAVRILAGDLDKIIEALKAPKAGKVSLAQRVAALEVQVADLVAGNVTIGGVPPVNTFGVACACGEVATWFYDPESKTGGQASEFTTLQGLTAYCAKHGPNTPADPDEVKDTQRNYPNTPEEAFVAPDAKPLDDDEQATILQEQLEQADSIPFA